MKQYHKLFEFQTGQEIEVTTTLDVPFPEEMMNPDNESLHHLKCDVLSFVLPDEADLDFLFGEEFCTWYPNLSGGDYSYLDDNGNMLSISVKKEETRLTFYFVKHVSTEEEAEQIFDNIVQGFEHDVKGFISGWLDDGKDAERIEEVLASCLIFDMPSANEEMEEEQE